MGGKTPEEAQGVVEVEVAAEEEEEAAPAAAKEA